LEKKYSKILLFDGECNLCNSTVQFVIKHDAKANIKFASLQSEFGQKLMKKFEIHQHYLDSIIFIEGNIAYYKSTAALRLFRQLDGWWKLTYAFMIVPKLIRNLVYDYIARNRVKWFGKAQTCWVMTPDLKDRFLS
jgi:predicted DCC family thiol-disulfide oxidoreductase YuxK